MTQKISTKFRRDHPNGGANCRWVGKDFFSANRKVSGSDALAPKKIFYPPRRSASSMCAGGEIGIRCVINNSGGSRNLMITATVQLTQKRLVVRNYVDDTHGIACSLCDSWIMRVQNYAGITKKWKLQKVLLRLTGDPFALFVQLLAHFYLHRASRGSLSDS